VELTGRVIKRGTAAGRALVSPEPIGFLGGVDPVGSYTLYWMKKVGTAPAAILNAESETIVAVGAIISDIPMLDRLDLSRITTGDWVEVEGTTVEVRKTVE
jgi:predicted aconitase with swiveling domain